MRRTPLAIAAIRGHVSLVGALLRAGADADLCDAGGKAPRVLVDALLRRAAAS